MNISNTKNLRQINRDKVMDIFMEQETCTKNQLALATGLSLATITNILKELLASNEVLKDGELESTGGRKSVVYSLNSDYSRMLTISVNKEYRRVHLIYRVYNLADEIVFSDEVIKKEVKVNDIYDIINIVLAKFDNIKVIGISMPGIINDGRVTSTGLTNFNDIDLYSLLTNKYSQVIILGNDVNTAVIGFYLAEKNYENVCLLFQPGEGYQR